MNTSSSFALPLVLGVTGHRKRKGFDIADPRLLAAIRSELLKIRTQYPHCPFVVLSGLAEGADRVLASLAMDCLDAHLIAVLPFEEAEFRRDFSNEESQEEFTRLLALAQATVVCRPNDDVDGVIKGGEARNCQYARVGGYLVEHSQLMIAIWDGEGAKGTGGTGDVVGWWSNAEVPVEYSSLAGERNVLSGSKKYPSIRIHPSTHKVTTATEGADFADSLKRIDNFNSDAARLRKKSGDEERQRSRSYLFAGRGEDAATQGDAGLRKLVDLYSAADTLAIHFQKKDAVLIQVIAIALFVSLLVHPLLVLVLLIGWLGQRTRFEDRFFDYRALAEGLRVAVYWRIAGISRRVSLNYLSAHMGVLSWIHEGLRSAEVASLPDAQASATPSPERISMVREFWLKDQAAYFEAKLEPLRENVERYHRIGWVSAGVSAAAGILEVAVRVEAIGHLFGSEETREAVMWYVEYGSKFLVAVAVATAFYASKKAYNALSKRYELSSDLYKRAQSRLDIEGYLAEEILVQIGREALNENADWLWRHREIPLTPHH